MLRKLIAVIAVAALAVGGAGCKKSSKPAAPQKTEVKSAAEYDAQAKKEISNENMNAELDKIEKEVEKESSGEF